MFKMLRKGGTLFKAMEVPSRTKLLKNSEVDKLERLKKLKRLGKVRSLKLCPSAILMPPFRKILT